MDFTMHVSACSFDPVRHHFEVENSFLDKYDWYTTSSKKNSEKKGIRRLPVYNRSELLISFDTTKLETVVEDD